MEDQKVVYPEWVKTLVPNAVRTIEKVAREPKLVAVKIDEHFVKQTYRVMIKKTSCYAVVVYCDYKEYTDYHVSIHLK